MGVGDELNTFSPRRQEINTQGITYSRASMSEIEYRRVRIDKFVFGPRRLSRIERSHPRRSIVRSERRVKVPKSIADILKGRPKAGIASKGFGESAARGKLHEDASLALAEEIHRCVGDAELW